MNQQHPDEKTETDIERDRITDEIAALERELEGYSRYGRDDRAAAVEDAITAAKARRKALGKGSKKDAAETAVVKDPKVETSVPANQTETAVTTAPGTETAVVPPAAPVVDLDALKVADLKAHAEKNQIDLGGASKKADIIAAIKKAARA